MPNDQLGSAFPAKYWLPGFPQPAIVEFYVDWLLQELDKLAAERWPILKQIKGWRRAEVIAYLESRADWTEGVLNTKMEV